MLTAVTEPRRSPAVDLQEPDEIVDAILATDPRWVADPYPLYAKLRAEAPVHRSSTTGIWFVSSYEDAFTVFRHPAISYESLHDDPGLAFSPTLRRWASSVIFLDPPEHDRIRGVIRLAFTKRRLEDDRAYVEQIVHRFLSEACDARTFDYIGNFAHCVSIAVTCHLLGIPQSDHMLLADWAASILSSNHPNGVLADMQLEQTDEVTLALDDYLRDLMRERKHASQNDLLSLLVVARDEEDRLTEDEAIGLAVILLLAGSDATGNLIGNGTIALLDYPDEMARLQSDVTLLPNAIEEFLRFNSVQQTASPKFSRDAKLCLARGSMQIPEGERIVPLVAAANRDPARFERPDELDIRRRDANRHLGFGGGRHSCLGMHLARLVASIAFPRVIQQFQTIDVLDDPLRWKVQGITRGLERLMVSVVPS